jgi:hypothetical protein
MGQKALPGKGLDGDPGVLGLPHKTLEFVPGESVRAEDHGAETTGACSEAFQHPGKPIDA